MLVLIMLFVWRVSGSGGDVGGLACGRWCW